MTRSKIISSTNRRKGVRFSRLLLHYPASAHNSKRWLGEELQSGEHGSTFFSRPARCNSKRRRTRYFRQQRQEIPSSPTRCNSNLVFFSFWKVNRNVPIQHDSHDPTFITALFSVDEAELDDREPLDGDEEDEEDGLFLRFPLVVVLFRFSFSYN